MKGINKRGDLVVFTDEEAATEQAAFEQSVAARKQIKAARDARLADIPANANSVPALRRAIEDLQAVVREMVGYNGGPS